MSWVLEGRGTHQAWLLDGERELGYARLRSELWPHVLKRRWEAAAAQLSERASRQLAARGLESFPRQRTPPAPGASRVSLLIRELFAYNQWNVGTVERAVRSLDDLSAPLQPCWLPPRNGRAYLADPFPLNAREFLVEEYHPGRNGWISRVGPNGVTPAIHEPFHLSFPGLVRRGSELFCVPESFQTGSCRLYRQEGERWVFQQTLIEGEPFVDPVVFEHEGRWWLLCSDTQCCRLLGFYAEQLEGPWHPHPLNPLKIDARGGRPAGPVFRLQGQLYRPGQNCVRAYGEGIVIFAIEHLSRDYFCEREALYLGPLGHGPYPHGLHHLVVEPERLVLDGHRTHHHPLQKLRSS